MENIGGSSQIKKFCPAIVKIYQKYKKPDFKTLMTAVDGIVVVDASMVIVEVKGAVMVVVVSEPNLKLDKKEINSVT